MATPSELHDQIGDMWNLYRKCLPNVAKAYDELPMEVYKDGALPGKIKRLMALTGALVHGCLACLLFQTDVNTSNIGRYRSNSEEGIKITKNSAARLFASAEIALLSALFALYE
jgi:alkylhydroperoxidase/carboxymuconolactone decarboxylase family protein YurZ